MKAFINFLTVILVLTSFMTPEEQSGWIEYQRKRIGEIGNEPTFDQIQMLCDLVASESDSAHSNEIRPIAWVRLQQIPDFPDRIYKNIIDSKTEWASSRENPYRYNKARGWGIPRLGRLPHHGSVRVLGEFLYDDELPGYDSEFEAAVKGGTSSNSIFAVRALGRLVDKPPVQGDPEKYTRNDVRAWQLWFEQVKSGNRTFRLKGDPQEYNLAGPVREGLSPLDAAPRDSSPASDQASVGDERNSRVPFVAIVTAVGLLAVAIGTMARRKAMRD